MQRNQLPDQVTSTMAALMRKWRFISVYLMVRCKVVYDPATPTAATDGVSIFVGDWFLSLSPKERLFVMAHEVMHAMLRHMGRLKEFQDLGRSPDGKPVNPKKWNIAADYHINHLLRVIRCGEMPRDGLYSQRYTSEMSVEDIYAALEDPEDEGGKGRKGQPGEEGEQDGHGGFDEHLPAPEDTPSETDARTTVQRAAAEAKAVGQLPAQLERWVKELIEPKVPWKDLLREFVETAAGRDELTWRRPNRRKLALPPYIPMPGRDGFALNCVVIAVDVSGSIGDEALALFLTETKAVLEDLRPRELWIVWWDAAAEAIDVTDWQDIEEHHPAGGGGTDYSCVPPVLNELGIDPDVVICMTDGWVDWPSGAAVPWPHITVSTSQEVAPFGRTIFFE